MMFGDEHHIEIVRENDEAPIGTIVEVVVAVGAQIDIGEVTIERVKGIIGWEVERGAPGVFGWWGTGTGPAFGGGSG